MEVIAGLMGNTRTKREFHSIIYSTLGNTLYFCTLNGVKKSIIIKFMSHFTVINKFKLFREFNLIVNKECCNKHVLTWHKNVGNLNN